MSVAQEQTSTIISQKYRLFYSKFKHDASSRPNKISLLNLFRYCNDGMTEVKAFKLKTKALKEIVTFFDQ